MPRDLTATIQAVLNSKSHNVWLAVDITTPDAQTIRACEVEATVTSLNLLGASVEVEPVVYPAILKEEPAIKFSRGRAPSGGTLVLFDLDHFLGVLTGQIESILENSSIVITTLFQKANQTFEADIYFVGVIRDVKASDEETSFNVVADTDTKTHFVANRALTQRCLAIYGDDKCRRPQELIAPGETCSNIFDDAENGCLSKRWQFAFWGVPILKNISAPMTGTGWTPGGPYGSNNCPSIENFSTVIDFKGDAVAIRVGDLKQGMIVQDALGRRAMIDHIEFVYEENMLRVECLNGFASECSISEPFITSIYDAKGKRAESLVIDVDTILCYDLETAKSETSVVSKKEKIAGRMVARITLSNVSASLYLSGVHKTKQLCRHNGKMPL